MASTPKPPPLAKEIRQILVSKAITDHADSMGQDHTDAQVQAIIDLLQARGHLLLMGPTAKEAHTAAGTFATQFVFARLVVQLLRVTLLAGIVMPETVEAMDWLKSYIDGNGHGPVGEEMRWPEGLLGTAAILRQLGFEPTETMPPYVRRARPAEKPATVN